MKKLLLTARKPSAIFTVKMDRIKHSLVFKTARFRVFSTQKNMAGDRCIERGKLKYCIQSNSVFFLPESSQGNP